MSQESCHGFASGRSVKKLVLVVSIIWFMRHDPFPRR